MKLRPCPLLLLIYFALNSSVPGFIFLFKNKEFTLSVFSVCSFKESPDIGTSRKINTVEKEAENSQVDFAAFSRAIRN